MSRTRKLYDRMLQGITWLASILSAWILVAIFLFIFSRGWQTLDWNLIRRQYRAENIVASFEQAKQKESAGNFARPDDLDAQSVFSERFGIAFRDGVSSDKKALLEVTYLAEDSPLAEAYITTAGARQGERRGLETGLYLQKISYLNAAGQKRSAGIVVRQDAAALVGILDDRENTILDYYAQTAGGGMYGSIIVTLILTGLTLLIALPIGVASAIYLHELAKKNRLTELVRSSIELLSGVPSIVFGLMGMTMLYPITRLFGINGQSIFLGSLTLAVILLPVIIRQTEEALMNVPVGMRMASLSLGATQTQTIVKVILPQAMPGILSATLLSVSRIIGESAALIFTMGTAVNDMPGWKTGGTSLAVQIWSVMGGEQPNFELASAISIVILAFVLLLNVAVKLITYYLTKRRLQTS